MKKVLFKVISSTLVEVVVAVVISFVVFGFAISIYLNLVSSGGTYRRMRAEAILEEQFVKMKQEKRYEPFVFKDRGFVVSCSLQKLANGLLKLTFEARDQNVGLLVRVNHFVLNDYEE